MRSVKWVYLIAAVGLLITGLIVAVIWRTGIVAFSHETGYFAPLFVRDGEAVIAIHREVRATITGLGWEFFTPPATVRLRRDRFSLIEIRVSDRRVTVLEEFPPSPLEGGRIQAYHGAIFGVPHTHLRWADADHLDYEIAVTRHDTPAARTFVIRKVWNPQRQAYDTRSPWQEMSTTMSGDEPQQLSGDMETIAVPGEELMPCAIALLRRDGSPATPLVETSTCRRKYPSGLSSELLAPISRRAEIERAVLIRRTYANLVERGRPSGRNEGEAMLQANKEMQRLGLYPKTPVLIAERTSCAEARPLFPISDDEFMVGLFPDIAAAIENPGTEVDKSMGAYITHRDYTTSRQLNEYLNSGRSIFFVRAHGACWRLTIHRP